VAPTPADDALSLTRSRHGFDTISTGFDMASLALGRLDRLYLQPLDHCFEARRLGWLTPHLNHRS
jgi:hypothetical protein